MQQAIEKRKRQKRRIAAFHLLIEDREKRPKLSDKKLRRLREEGRP
jgi:hypothetical protein